jgi:radical SAM protein with 4Fe4S-binding SPASM domain
MVLMRRNRAELDGVVALAARFGVEAVFVQRLCHDFSESTLPGIYRPMRQFIDEEALDETDHTSMQLAFDRARASAARLGVTLRLPRIAHRPGPPACDWPWRGAYVSYAGEAMPCCMVATPDRARLGNMIEDGVEATWNGERYAHFRHGLATGDPPEVCRSCSLYRGTF